MVHSAALRLQHEIFTCGLHDGPAAEPGRRAPARPFRCLLAAFLHNWTGSAVIQKKDEFARSNGFFK